MRREIHGIDQGEGDPLGERDPLGEGDPLKEKDNGMVGRDKIPE